MALIDNIILQIDGALRTLSTMPVAQRDNPAGSVEESEMSDTQRVHAAGLMRVNHAGEICAQALYEGQALVAKDAQTRTSLESAAQEETDHLAWCEQRLIELESKPSIFNPMFYAASYTLGALTGLLGDKISLGFVEATEDQVCKHLESHLQILPEQDQKSRRILEQMYVDEARHGEAALAAGGVEFPEPVKGLMSLASRVMTKTAYKL